MNRYEYKIVEGDDGFWVLGMIGGRVSSQKYFRTNTEALAYLGRLARY